MNQPIKKYLLRYSWFRKLPITINIKLSCIVYRDNAENEWIARCLDLNLIATNAKKMEAVKDLNNLIVAQIQFTADNDNWAHLFRPASKKEWERFEHAKRACLHAKTTLATNHIQSTLDTCFA